MSENNSEEKNLINENFGLDSELENNSFDFNNYENDLKSDDDVDKKIFLNSTKNNFNVFSLNLYSENLEKNSNEIDSNNNENHFSSNDDNIKKELKCINNTNISTSLTENLNQNNQEQNLLNDDENSKNNINNNYINNDNNDIVIEINNNNSVNNEFHNKDDFIGKKTKRKPKNQNNIINYTNNNNNNLNIKKIRTDNIDRQIRNNSHEFIINFLNNKIKENFGYQIKKFRKIEYKIINKQNNNTFFNQKLKTFIENDISSKFQRKFNEQNKENLEYILEKEKKNGNNYFKDLIEKTVGYFYKNYFIKDYFDINKDIKKEINNEIEILCFEDFIKKLREKNEDEFYIKKVEEIAEKILKENFDNDGNYIEIHKNKKNKKLFCIEK